MLRPYETYHNIGRIGPGFFPTDSVWTTSRHARGAFLQGSRFGETAWEFTSSILMGGLRSLQVVSQSLFPPSVRRWAYSRVLPDVCVWMEGAKGWTGLVPRMGQHGSREYGRILRSGDLVVLIGRRNSAGGKSIYLGVLSRRRQETSQLRNGVFHNPEIPTTLYADIHSHRFKVSPVSKASRGVT